MTGLPGTSARAKVARVLSVLTMVFVFEGFHSRQLMAQDPPAELRAQLLDETVTLDWEASPGALGYNVYRNDEYLSTVSATRFSEPFAKGEVATYYIVAFSASPTVYSARSQTITVPESAQPQDPTIPPTVPANLTGEIDGSTVALHWDVSTDDEEVAGYNVYVNGRYRATVQDNQWQGSVEPGLRYTFSVVAFDIRRNFSIASDTLRLPESDQQTDTTPPGIVESLRGRITGGSEGVVELRWEPPTDDDDVAGYNVYKDGQYLTTVFTESYSGSVNATLTHEYYVVAFDFSTNFGNRSETLVLPVVDDDEGSLDNEAPSAPDGLVARITSNNTLSLVWSASTDNRGVAGYNVYQNDEYLTTVAGTRFDQPANGYENVSFYVIAFDEARNFSPRSEEAGLSLANNQAPLFPVLPDIDALAGETVAVRLAPSDPDGTVPGMLIGPLPEGMISEDNLDSTRTLKWRPLEPDVGSYTISVTAIDELDPTLRTTQSFVLRVELPDDPSTIVNLPPGINFIGNHVVRAGDAVVMEVKATDPNGTIPALSSPDLPDGARFEPHPEFGDTKVLRWTPERSDLGSRKLTFRAIDSVDSSLQTDMTVILDIRDPAEFTRPGERLKALAALQNIQIGYASLLQFYNRPDADLYLSVAREEFNLVTPENSMKWAYINPEPGEYRWEAADRLIRFAAESDMQVHGHTLVWYAALPQWVQLSAIDQREALMYDFIDAMTSRYPSVAIWDVVNEAFEDDGSYRHSTWFEAMGKSYISKAFSRAKARAPAAVLLYNDYDISYAGPKSEAVLELMKELLDSGVPVDGIGLQMHLDTSFNRFESVDERMAEFAALGLDIYITELDVSIVDGDDELDQARVYESVVRACVRQVACKAIQFWGITDRYSWRKAFNPLPLDAEYQAKPAYLAVQRALAGE